MRGVAEPPANAQVEAAAQITAQDIAAAREFWRYWGTPLFNALLDAACASHKRAVTLYSPDLTSKRLDSSSGGRSKG